MPLETDDVLTEEEIWGRLSEDSPIRRVVCLETVDSTNTYAKGLVLQGAEDGVLVAANQQTAGRGRRGRSFLSPPGTGLYMTLILRPRVEMERFQMITLAAATAVCLTLEALTPLRPLIKWVNDIFLPMPSGRCKARSSSSSSSPTVGDEGRMERKVCGILAEAVTGADSGKIDGVVVGIGVNVATRDFGEELDGLAGSLLDGGDICRVGRAQLAAGIAERLMDLAERLDDPELIRLYRERSLLLGRRIRWNQGDETLFGRALDIDAQGGLLVELDGAEKRRTSLRSGEVFEVRPL